MTFIRALYQNQAVLNLRKTPVLLSAMLFVLVVFLLTLPYQIGSFGVSGQDLLNQLPGFEEDFAQIMETYDCVIDRQLSCTQSNINTKLKTYRLALLYDAYEQLDTKQLIVLNADYMTVTNGEGQVIVVGNYSNIGILSFQDLQKDIEKESIDFNQFTRDFLRLIDLSQFLERFYVQMSIVAIQNTIYVGVIAFFLGFIQRKKDVTFKFSERFTMVVMLMFSPALLSVLMSFYVPEGALIGFSVVLMARLYFLYQGLLRQTYVV